MTNISTADAVIAAVEDCEKSGDDPGSADEMFVVANFADRLDRLRQPS